MGYTESIVVQEIDVSNDGKKKIYRCDYISRLFELGKTYHKHSQILYENMKTETEKSKYNIDIYDEYIYIYLSLHSIELLLKYQYSIKIIKKYKSIFETLEENSKTEKELRKFGHDLYKIYKEIDSNWENSPDIDFLENISESYKNKEFEYYSNTNQTQCHFDNEIKVLKKDKNIGGIYEVLGNLLLPFKNFERYDRDKLNEIVNKIFRNSKKLYTKINLKK